MRLSLAFAASALAVAAAASAQTLTPEPWDARTSTATELESAKRGHVPSLISLARRHQSGDGVVRNPDLAADYWAAAAISDPAAAMPGLRALAADNVRAKTLLGRLLLSESTPAARAEARAMLTVAADAGSADANFILATMLAGSQSRADRREAQVLFARAERAGGWLGSTSRFLREQVGRGRAMPAVALPRGAPLVRQVRSDPPATRPAGWEHWGLTPREDLTSPRARSVLAARIFTIAGAAHGGDANAWLLFMAETSMRCVEDGRLYRPACVANYDSVSPALDYSTDVRQAYIAELPERMAVAKMFELGTGGPEDFMRARGMYDWIKFYGGSYGGDGAEASYRLSLMTDKGQGAPADPVEARRLLVEAADRGHPIAAYGLALEKLRANDMEGLDSYLRAAANGGNADAAYAYAELLRENKLTAYRRDRDLLKYFTQAAEAGNRRAFYGVGLCYWNGWGVAADEAQAEYWWEKAARVGDPKAADHVAALHLQRGDPPGAIPWLRRAAQGGHPGSAAKLQEVLDKGWRERSLGGFLMGVLDFVGDVGTGMAEAYQYQMAQEQAEIQRQMMYYSAAMAGGGSSEDSGGADSSADGGDGSGDFAAGEGDDFGSDDYGGSDSAGGYGSDDGGSGSGGGDFVSGGGGGSGFSDASSPDGGFGGSSGSDGAGSYASASSEESNGAGGYGSDGGESSGGAIIVSDGIDHEWEARQAQLQAESLALQQRMAAEAAQAKADHDAAVAADEAKAREDAAAYAASDCAKPEVVCVSPQ